VGVEWVAVGRRTVVSWIEPVRRVILLRGRLVATLALALVVFPVLLLGLYPTRPFLAQRTATHQAEDELDRLQRENRELEERVKKLQTPEEIERLARRDHGLVRPGEQAFAILPDPPEPVDLPEVWPFKGADAELNGQ
jgi:cell division protein FtsB